MRCNARPGFTLVEVMVVIGIIAVLIGILLPVGAHVRRQARVLQCQSNLRQFDTALRQWAMDHDGVLPDATFWAAAVMEQSAGVEGILDCPETDSGGEGSPYAAAGSLAVSFWNGKHANSTPGGSRASGGNPWRRTVTSSDEDSFTLSYTFKPQNGNHQTGDMVIEGHRTAGNTWVATIVKPNPYPTKYRYDLVVLSSGVHLTDVSHATAPVELEAMNIGGIADYGYNALAGGVRLSNLRTQSILVVDYDHLVADCVNDDLSVLLPADRHSDRVNVLLADGSVKNMPLEELPAQSSLWDAEPNRARPQPDSTPPGNPGGGNSGGGNSGGGNSGGGNSGGGNSGGGNPGGGSGKKK